MSVSAETYIVISLMFAVFAAVAAVGTSVVLGAGFERLRAGFEIVRKQSGFFADAIYKLDLRTQKLGEDTEKLKAGLGGLGDRMERAEQTASFLADSMTSIEHRILEGSPVHAPARDTQIKPRTVYAEPHQSKLRIEQGSWQRETSQKTEQHMKEPATVPAPNDREKREFERISEAVPENPEGLTTLLSRYFLGETSGNGHQIVYH